MAHKNYDHFSIEDFASDDHFIEWCLSPTHELNEFWNEWLTTNPDKKQILEEARRTISIIHKAETTNVQSVMKKDIWSSLEHHMHKEKEVAHVSRPTLSMTKIAGIAAGILLLAMAYFTFQSNSESVSWEQFANHTSSTETIALADGTQINLIPNSTLQYSSKFGQEKREIILEGEAFFDVARDTSKPFLIYANKTITKVLGTSFHVKAQKDATSVEVEVATGKVAVYANTLSADAREESPVIFKKGEVEILKPNLKINLTPNEKITFDITQKNMIKSIVEQPKLVQALSTLPKHHFDNAPVIDIFNTIEQAYGIQIDYNEKQLKNCSLSTKLDDTPLFTKLNIICTALDLRYEVNNAIIYIEGSGC